MKRTLLVLIMWMLCQPTVVVGQEPRRIGQETFIARAIFADGQLWLMSDAGVLSSITEGKDDPIEVVLPEAALDLWLEDGQPAVISCSRPSCTDWLLRRRSGSGEWNVTARVATLGDHFVTIAKTNGGITVLTHRRIIDLAGGKENSITMSGALQPKPIASTHVTPTSVFIGFNAGEWGGGLQRIDRKTGEVVSVERKESGEFCFRPLHSACDPVNGIATAPWNPDCVVVAVGLVHFQPSGRLLEVCGNVVRWLYVKAHPRPSWWPPANKADKQPPPDKADVGDREPFPSVAFFGLSRQGETLWAVGIDGIYQVERDGGAQSNPLPPFKRVGEFLVSFDLPSFVLVLTDVNQRRSISGSVPLLVPR